MSIYSLDVMHNGTTCGDFCIYQVNDNQDEDIRSLVWFKKTAHPHTQLHFEWNLKYGIVWSETGVLEAGIVFRASEVKAADPRDITSNSVGFAMDKNSYHFVSTNNPTSQGKMGIECASTIPAGRVSIGIAMSNRPAFARVAHPSLKYTFSPHPKYFIAFGDFEEGEVLDLNRMTHKYEIDFKVNQYERSIELRSNNTWGDLDA